MSKSLNFGLSYLRLILGYLRQALPESRLHLRHVVVQVCPGGSRLSLEALKVVCVQFPIVGPILLVLDLHHYRLMRTNYIDTSGFWPRVRARALRAPVFLGLLTGQLACFAASYSSSQN